MRYARLLSALLIPLVGCVVALGQGYPPGEAARHMTVADGFRVNLVAGEPMVRQPVAIEFDDRGRLWVVQYLQYPNPAGLKRVKVDRYSRTVYDRVPEPPPRGPRGADRITILENPDVEGRPARSRDFVSGLNLATGIAFGHGGVFVLQVPYLLFYPDKDGDGVPDGDPQVLLTGFGMEDAHSVANSLTWGPDGWLYGCQGSTVTAKIRGIEFQQGVWRYHPLTRRFELFCEGGGNSWGLDFDAHGNLLYSTNYGGHVMLHGVQGAYYWKSFGKHGALHNPYAYGYFDHVPHRHFKGGHVTVGGTVYQGDSFPARFRGTYINGDLLGHAVYWNTIERKGSSFASAFGGDLLLANDTWFATTDVTTGPDGAIYVADWFDKRTAHPDPDADWDRTNGRIYRIQAVGARPAVRQNLTKLSSKDLAGLLSHPNDWYVRKARRILADRRDPHVIPPLRRMVLEGTDDHLALEALWALYVSGGFDEAFADKLLGHHNPDIRRWTVRFLGDERQVAPALARRLVELAATDADVTVRSQLASTAQRLPAADGLPIATRILFRDEDGHDPHLPLLLWWAVERHAVAALGQVVEPFAAPAAWRSALVRDVILERLTRRYAAEGTDAAYAACGRLLASAPSAGDRRRLLASLDQGLLEQRHGTFGPDRGDLYAGYGVGDRPASGGARRTVRVSAALERQLDAVWSDDTADPVVIRLMARLGRPAAPRRALELARDARTPAATRLEMLRVLGELGPTSSVRPLLALVAGKESDAIRRAALDALQHFDADAIAEGLLRLYPRLGEDLRGHVRDVLLSRQRWALAYVEAIDAGKFPAKDVTVEQLRQVSLYPDRRLHDLVRKHWGSIQAGTPEEKLAEVRRLSNDLRAGLGSPAAGRLLFQKHCATCHRLFGEGNQVGPELTHANRHDQNFLLVSLVDPSAVIRKEYMSYVVQTTDGRLLTGLIAEQSANSLTVLNAKNERTTVPRDQVEALRESPVSLMPENLYKEFKPAELRDLFAYLQSAGPPAK